MAAKPDKSCSPNGPSRVEKPCPICGKAATDEMKPFCSKRCADVDLHRWLGGVYAVPADDDPSDEEP